MTGTGTPVPAQGALVPDGWEQPPRRLAGPAGAPVLEIGNFEGPLDWLLELARSRRIDLARLSITALVDAFGTALSGALGGADKQPMALAQWSGWLVMAAELTLLRSRLLLPVDAPDAQAAHDEAERLRRALLGRAETARAADWLDERTQLGRDVFPNGRTKADRGVRAQRTGDITALLRACLAAIRLPAEAEDRFRLPERPFWSVAQALTRMQAMLPALGEGGHPLASFLPPVAADAPQRERRCRTAVSATFLASLELARQGSAILAQKENWQAIQVISANNDVSAQPL